MGGCSSSERTQVPHGLRTPAPKTLDCDSDATLPDASVPKRVPDLWTSGPTTRSSSCGPTLSTASDAGGRASVSSAPSSPGGFTCTCPLTTLARSYFGAVAAGNAQWVSHLFARGAEVEVAGQLFCGRDAIRAAHQQQLSGKGQVSAVHLAHGADAEFVGDSAVRTCEATVAIGGDEVNARFEFVAHPEHSGLINRLTVTAL